MGELMKNSFIDELSDKLCFTSDIHLALNENDIHQFHCKFFQPMDIFAHNLSELQLLLTLMIVTTIAFIYNIQHCTSQLNGVDFAGAVLSTSDFQCLQQEGYDFIIARAWHSYGAFDSDSVSNLENAQSAGYTSSATEVYMFPCASSAASAKQQMQSMIDSLSSSGVEYGAVWLDIEDNPDSDCSWENNDIDTNCDIIIALGNTTAENGINIGVYSSYYEWGNVFFGDYTACSQPAEYGWKVWYADYDDQENFDDFKAFGGWSSPIMKQYEGDASVCGLDVDLNWIP